MLRDGGLDENPRYGIFLDFISILYPLPPMLLEETLLIQLRVAWLL